MTSESRGMSDGSRTTIGRGAQIRPQNRFERVHLEVDPDALQEAAPSEPSAAEDSESHVPQRPRLPTQFLPDASQSILSHNDSPDVGFNWSINPYRGCEHGCM